MHRRVYYALHVKVLLQNLVDMAIFIIRTLLAYTLISLKSRRESLPTVRVITPVVVTLIYRILLG